MIAVQYLFSIFNFWRLGSIYIFKFLLFETSKSIHLLVTFALIKRGKQCENTTSLVRSELFIRKNYKKILIQYTNSLICNVLRILPSLCKVHSMNLEHFSMLSQFILWHHCTFVNIHIYYYCCRCDFFRKCVPKTNN